MLNLFEKNKIITKYIKGIPKAEIARETGISRPTVIKYIKQYEKNQEWLEKAVTIEEKEAIIESGSRKPMYNVSKRKRLKMTPEVEKIVQACLNENEIKVRNGNRKVIMKRKDIHEYIVEKGFTVSYRTVCQYIADKEEKAKEAFIKQSYPPGVSAEFDWGDVTLCIDELGGEHRMKIGVFTLKHSDYRFAVIYTHENTECFLDAHRRFFEHIKGIPKEMVYDNAKVQVRRFAGGVKKPTKAVEQLSSYYGFIPRYTNDYRGNEKGNVERSVEVVRRKAYCRKQCFVTVESAEAALMQAMDKVNGVIKQRTGISADAGLAEESKFLVPARMPMDVSVTIEASVNKYSLVYVDTNFYSVPDFLSEKKVMVRKSPDKIKVYYKDKFLFETKRILKGRNQYQIDIDHYLKTLKKKPGALTHSLALKQANPWLQKIFYQYYVQKPRDFIMLLELIKEYSLTCVQVAIKKLEMNKLPITHSYIYYELHNEARSVTLASPTVENKDEIQKACLSQLLAISSLYGQGVS